MCVCVCVCWCVCVFQGARVWVREKEQLVPSTVNSCGDGTLVVTTDYGEVRAVSYVSFTGLQVDIHHPLALEPRPLRLRVKHPYHKTIIPP